MLTNPRRYGNILKSKPTKQFVVKAMWDATALLLKVYAEDEDDAFWRAAKVVKKLEGGASCCSLKVIREVN